MTSKTNEGANAKGERFTYIDALRGIAAVWVMFHHFIYGHMNAVSAHGMAADALRTVAAYGYLGVEIFFVLSGFVISYSVRNASITTQFVGKFALRRSVRLDPPYWFVIFLTYSFDRLSRGPLGASVGMPEWLILGLNCIYLNRMIGAPTVVAVGWTMCQEIQFYLVFILLLGLSQRLTGVLKSKKLARFIIFAPLAAFSVTILLGYLPTPLPHSFFELWHLFFAGVIVSWSVFGEMSRIWASVLILILIVVGLVYVEPRIIAAGVTAASILLVARYGGLTTFLNIGILQYLGRISYSLYLVHPLVGNRFLRLSTKWTGESPSLPIAACLVVIAVTLSLLAAHFMYKYIERPSISLAKRIKLIPK